MIKCPKCGHTLPANYMICQFCGADVSTVPRPTVKEAEKATYKMVTKGTMIGFYIMSTIFVLLGGFQIIAGVGVIGNVGDFIKNIYIVFGSIMALIGIGLMFRAAFVYAMMGVFCAISVVLGIVDIIAAVMTVDVIALRITLIVMGVFQMLAAGFMFYYAEETAVTSMT